MSLLPATTDICHDAEVAPRILTSVISLVESHRGRPLFAASAWMHAGPMSVYIRYTQRFLDETKRYCIDVANVSIQPAWQNRGHSTDLIAQLQQYAKAEGLSLYIENVLHPAVDKVAVRMGFVVHPHNGIAGCHCYYWIPE